MTHDAECRRVAAVLARLDEPAPEPPAEELERVAAHLEACPRCGVGADVRGDVERRLRELDPELPGEELFAASARSLLAEIEREDARAFGRGRPAASAPARGRARRRAPASGGRRVGRIVGAAVAAAAAGVALVLAIGGDPAPTGAPAPPGPAPVDVVSVDGIDAARLAAAEDAWLVARYDLFDLEIAEDTTWRLQDLSDEELDALEGLFGSAPGVG